MAGSRGPVILCPAGYSYSADSSISSSSNFYHIGFNSFTQDRIGRNSTLCRTDLHHPGNYPSENFEPPLSGHITTWNDFAEGLCLCVGGRCCDSYSDEVCKFLDSTSNTCRARHWRSHCSS